MVDLMTVTSAMAKRGAAVAWDKAKRKESVIKLLQRFHLDPNNPPTDFDAVYVYTLIQYGVGRPEPILNFFRNEFIRDAFRQSFYNNDPSILENEAEGIIQWNEETGKLGRIDYNPRREFVTFRAVFDSIVDQIRTPVEVKSDQKLDTIYDRLYELIAHVDRLENLIKVREVVARAQQDSALHELAQHMRGWFRTLNYSFEQYEEQSDVYFAWIMNVPTRRGYDRILVHGLPKKLR